MAANHENHSQVEKARTRRNVMLIVCTNKNCYDQNEHLLHTDTNEVVCVKCDRVIDVPQTTKKTLSSLKQIAKQVKKALEFECKGCKKTSRPLIRAAGKTSIAVCRHCGERFNISQPFVEALKMVKEDTDDAEARTPAKKPGAKQNPSKADPVPALQPKPRQAGAGVSKKAKAK